MRRFFKRFTGVILKGLLYAGIKQDIFSRRHIIISPLLLNYACFEFKNCFYFSIINRLASNSLPIPRLTIDTIWGIEQKKYPVGPKTELEKGYILQNKIKIQPNNCLNLAMSANKIKPTTADYF